MGAAEGLPKKKGHHAHIEADVGLACQQIALLHQRGQGGGQGHQGGHGEADQQMGTYEKLAIIQISDGHPAEGAQHHKGQQQAAGQVVATAKLPLDEILALLSAGGAELLGLDAQVHRIEREPQQGPHQ